QQTETQNARTEQTRQEEAGTSGSTKQPAAGQGNGIRRGKNGKEGTGNTRNTGNNASLRNTAGTGQPDKTSQNAQKGTGQSNQTNQANQASQTTQNGIGTNRIGQTNSLSMVDRQRLARQKKAKTAAKKKNLNYNRREVSSQVLRANKIGSAARALATARTKVSSLRRCVGTGQYDENELRIAISHAESIVKTAKKKVANLKEERIKEKRVAREKQTNTLKKQVKKQRIRAQRQQVKREAAMQRKQMERQTKMKEMRCKQLKRRHRGEELADVAEADIKYIKDMDRYRRYGTTEGSRTTTTDTTGTAALEIGDSAMRLSDLERTEQALKYEEQQANQEIATFSGSSASGSVDISIGDGVSGGGEISGGADMAAVAAVGGAVDVSL
ncbi:MAG: hypothetical protein K2O03_11745, partial [Lachnospiraceae bacterium]|nr:hypothetical protein [Lachnospiraceae bacterium]